ncbi:MAG: type II toxin-antitoxin system RelE/ParE family toxin [bacterium]|nr:type II toxin-antitoxin system RelE/ParE family toxin [bacterium]
MLHQDEYSVKFYKDKEGKAPVQEFLDNLPIKEKAKAVKYIEFLRVNSGILDEPYSRHIRGKIRELRVDFGHARHRIFYLLFVKKTIVLLHAFTKNTAKTPWSEMRKAEHNMQQAVINQKIYE